MTTFSLGNIISQSLQITLRNQGLWLLGFLTMLMSSTINFAVNPGLGQIFANPGIYTTGGIYRDSALSTWNSSMGCVSFLLLIGFFFVGSILQAATIYSSDRASQGSTPTLRESWQVGRARMWPVVGLNAVLIGVAVAIVILFTIVLFCALGALISTIFSSIGSSIQQPGAYHPNIPDYSSIFGPAGIAICIIGLLFLPVVVTIAMIIVLGQREAVLHHYSFGQSWSVGWNLLRTNLGRVLLLLLAQVLISLVISIPLLIVNLTLPGFPASLLASPGISSGTVIGAAFITGLVVWLLNGLLGAIPVIWWSTGWTLFYRSVTVGWPQPQPVGYPGGPGYPGGYPGQQPSPGGYTGQPQYPGGYAPTPPAQGGYTQPGQYPGGYTPAPPTQGGYTQPGQYPGGYAPPAPPPAQGGYTQPDQYPGSYAPPPAQGIYNPPDQYPGGYAPPADNPTQTFRPSDAGDDRARGGPGGQ